MTIRQMLAEVGIERDDPEAGLQYNLVHASISEFGMRNGLDPRLIPIIRREFPSLFTDEALLSQRHDFETRLLDIFFRHMFAERR